MVVFMLCCRESNVDPSRAEYEYCHEQMLKTHATSFHVWKRAFKSYRDQKVNEQTNKQQEKQNKSQKGGQKQIEKKTHQGKMSFLFAFCFRMHIVLSRDISQALHP